MDRMGNVNNVNKQYIWSDHVGLVTKELGASVKSEKIYINMDCVPPKGYSTKYHSHSQQEEFFFILEGCGVLRVNNEEIHLQKGDYFSKPAGHNIAHTFFNSGDESLVILDIGTNKAEDTCYYPDEDIYMHRSNGKNLVTEGKSMIKNWSSDPND